MAGNSADTNILGMDISGSKTTNEPLRPVDSKDVEKESKADGQSIDNTNALHASFLTISSSNSQSQNVAVSSDDGAASSTTDDASVVGNGIVPSSSGAENTPGVSSATTTDTSTAASSSSAGGSGSSSGGSSSSSSSSSSSHVKLERRPWHTDDDSEIRKSMVSHIMEKFRLPNATEEWIQKVSTRMEESLYYAAKELDEYKNRETLKQRLQQLVADMSNKAKPPGQSGSNGQSSSSSSSENTVSKSAGTSGSNPETAGSTEHGTYDDHSQQIFVQQQKRLLLLRHASKCPYNAGDCRIEHCAYMKELWKHIMTCKVHHCETAHCVSSRYVLSHYSKCALDYCPVCTKVKEAIRKKSEQRSQQEHNQEMMKRQQQYNMSMNAKRYRGADGQIYVTQYAPPPLIPVKYPLDPVSCSMYCFTQDQIDNHLKRILEGVKITASKVRDYCLPMLNNLLNEKSSSAVFGAPVDPVSMELADYGDVVKFPMDLGTIRKKLDLSSYLNLDAFKSDVNLTFDNAIAYNPKGSFVYNLAKDLKKSFEALFKKCTNTIDLHLVNARANEENCYMCGGEHKNKEYKFEPAAYYCIGATCGGQNRIRRNAWYYSEKEDMWCTSCFNELKDGPLKRKLAPTKAKYDVDLDKYDEDFVQCNCCARWVHLICGLWNNRRNFNQATPFVCCYCITAKKKENPELLITATENVPKMRAHELPHSTMSLFLERRLKERLERAYKEHAEKLGVSIDEVEKCPELVLRQVSSVDTIHHVRELMYERYKDKGYPAEFPVKKKCICLFQNIDGQDTLLFAMFVYEYGHKCPAPNQRRIYISYLDSVHYLRPRQYRTQIYFEIIISYLDYVKRRGFHTAHIWASPPDKGDDYIFRIHPQDQKFPKKEKLSKWYADLLDEAKEREIVHDVCDLYTECFKDPTKDATTFPYFDGDHCVSMADACIKDLKEGKLVLATPVIEKDESEGGEAGTGGRLAKAKTKAKLKSMSKSSEIKLTDKTSDRDPIMVALATNIECQKQFFFVAKLHPQEYADACATRRAKEIIDESKFDAEHRKKSEKENAERLEKDKMNATELSARKKTAMDSGSTDSATAISATQESMSVENDMKQEKEDKKSKIKEEKEEPTTPRSFRSTPRPDSGSGGIRRSSSRGSIKAKAKDEDDEQMEDKEEEATKKKETTKKGGPRKRGAAEMEEEEGADEKAAEDTEVKVKSEKVDDDVKMEESDVKDVESKAVDGDAKTEEKVAAPEKQAEEALPAGVAAGLDEHGIPVCFADLKDDTEDVDDIQENEHFENRQTFITLCTGNQYQFDQLRRAKHTSMMILYHLHNPDAPKFIPNCMNCRNEIITGYRHHCSTCSEDYCHQCVRNYGPRVHPAHTLRPIPVAGGAPVQLTEEQRKERAKSLALHMEYLLHSSQCNSPTCQSRTCAKMKAFIKHEQMCQIKAGRGCGDCKRANALLTLHARSCKLEVCVVPKCHEIREQIRQVTIRQQAMDDRRSAQMR